MTPHPRPVRAELVDALTFLRAGGEVAQSFDGLGIDEIEAN